MEQNKDWSKDAFPETPRSQTFGERLVGAPFNPSNDDKVAKAKALFAQIADLLKEEYTTRPAEGGVEVAELNAMLYTHAIGEIVNAQTSVSKVLTLNY